MINYYEMGQKIRKYRKMRDFSQEELAEMAGISVTHMSHIETGNAKLSLQVLADIAFSLQVSFDSLIINHQNNDIRSEKIDNINSLLKSCNETELNIVTDVLSSIVNAIKKYT